MFRMKVTVDPCSFVFIFLNTMCSVHEVILRQAPGDSKEPDSGCAC